MRKSITQNLDDIITLHDELLGELHRAVPNSEHTQTDAPLPKLPPVALNHRRWQSLDAVPENTGNLKYLQKAPGVMADASVAAEVANIFGCKVGPNMTLSDFWVELTTRLKVTLLLCIRRIRREL